MREVGAEEILSILTVTFLTFTKVGASPELHPDTVTNTKLKLRILRIKILTLTRVDRKQSL